MNLNPASDTDIKDHLITIKSILDPNNISYYGYSNLLSSLDRINNSVIGIKEELLITNVKDLDESIEKFDNVLQTLYQKNLKKETEENERKTKVARGNIENRVKEIVNYLDKPNLYILIDSNNSHLIDSKRDRKIDNYHYKQNVIFVSKEKTTSKNQYHIFCQLNIGIYGMIYKVQNLFAAKVTDCCGSTSEPCYNFVTDFVPIIEDKKFLTIDEDSITEIQKRAICKELAKFEKRIEKLNNNKPIDKSFRNYPGISPFKDALQNATMLE